jgi:glutathione peroxidase
MSIYDVTVRTIDGQETTLAQYKGKELLIVNVASKCGFTPQYQGLQKLYEEYSGRGLEILGFPSNQFGGQEPGTEDEIASFCSTTYGVSFPMFSKIDVNGENRHPLYAELTQAEDAGGHSGDVGWNFEKFVVSPEGEVVARFRTPVAPSDPDLVAAVEAQLPD